MANISTTPIEVTLVTTPSVVMPLTIKLSDLVLAVAANPVATKTAVFPTPINCVSTSPSYLKSIVVNPDPT